ncbi:MAG TPA: metallopeptidase family protein [Candidatus Saccharimonadales bacterium]|nr:metallopeptidase family protein [Candidatus Saccharimonadales bacterium]
MNLTDEKFQELIDRAFDSLPKTHRDRVRNVAILFSDEPTPEQRHELQLRNDQTLLGLYQGVPLSQRQGRESLLPDRITLFKWPLMMHSHDEPSLYEQIRHTLWHEIAHYYGLNHDKIRELEQ